MCALLATPAWADILSIPLVNDTGLDTNRHTIYVLGFSTGRTDPSDVAPTVLSVTGTNRTGSFVAQTNVEGYVESYKLGDEITGIDVDMSTNRIAGARVYFFVADSQLSYSSNGLPPRFSFLNSGRSVIQCANPPQSEYPIYNYIEFTYIHGDNYGAVIDVSVVDGFNFPISIAINDNLASPLGQPLGISSSNFNRSTIIAGYDSFMTNLAAEGGNDYLCLNYTNNLGRLLNPTLYLEADSEVGLVSPLNRVFDDALNIFFSASNATNLSITTDGSGAIAQDTYTATYEGNAVFTNSTLPHPALKFTGATYSNQYTVFNPVNFTVVSYADSTNGLNYIHGQMSNSTINFSSALPADTLIMPDMYVVGPGADDATMIIAVNTNSDGKIASLTLNKGTGIASAGNFQFRKSKDVVAVSSGAMVFGCHGLFDHDQGLTGDNQKVLLALKRDIVTAFNRGVANLSPAAGSAGRTSTYWGMQTNWYPEGEAQNLFSLYMHTACIKVNNEDVPIFTRPDDAAACARGIIMGMSYGFAYDENSVHVSVQQPQVPAKHDPLPASVTTTTVTLGPWISIETDHPRNDFSGDGKSDFVLFDQNTGTWHLLYSEGSYSVIEFGDPDFTPVCGDFDGDGKSDVTVYDEKTGYWWMMLSGSGYALSYQQFGGPGYLPVQ